MNIPFINALSQMPVYAKFLKEVLSKMRKIDEYEIATLGEECSVMALNKLPKLKDPSSFSILRLIGNISINRALCDLDSNVSLVPYSNFKNLI